MWQNIVERTKKMFEIYMSLLSLVLGFDIKEIKKALNREQLRSSGKLEISTSIEAVSKNLNASKDIIESTLVELENQKKLFEDMKKQAEISQQIASMNQEQVAALNKVLEKTLHNQEKKSFPKTVLWNLFFCVLSAILGFGLGKFL